MFKKHWQDCELSKNAQFDIYIYAITWWNLDGICKKNDNYVTDPKKKKKKMNIKAMEENW